METHPLADPKNVVKGDKYRITVLTEHLLRLEYSEDGEFYRCGIPDGCKP